MTGVRDMLAMDPDDAHAHANRGWLLLRRGQPDEAMQSFQSALRLDPTLDWARLGMIEAMKAGHVATRSGRRRSAAGRNGS
jgi:Tfp pilus assembly protein PilF